MTQRTYNQYCPIAHALDLIGDRWTLLIIRDLLLGPKRFSDLLGGLPGIGTNLLTDRLKSLEAAGVLQRRTLPPPAASMVYELTVYGQQLDGPLSALGRWGGATLGVPQPTHIISRDSVLLTLRALFRMLPTPDTPMIYAVHLSDAPFSDVSVHVAQGAVSIAHEAAPHADATLALDVATLFALASGALMLRAAVTSGAVQLGGSAAALAALLETPQPTHIQPA